MPEVLTRVDEDDCANTMEFDAEGARRYHTEHERLRGAVVEAAKAWTIDISADARESGVLRTAVDALLAFEAENKIGEK